MRNEFIGNLNKLFIDLLVVFGVAIPETRNSKIIAYPSVGLLACKCCAVWPFFLQFNDICCIRPSCQSSGVVFGSVIEASLIGIWIDVVIVVDIPVHLDGLLVQLVT
jgi:hypothetical protein